MNLIILYLIVGILSGFITGFLGGGSGPILIPILTALFIYQHISPELAIRLAVGSALGIAMLAMLAAMHAQRKQLPQIKEIVSQLLPGGIIGSVIGAILAGYLTGAVFKVLFASVLIGIAFIMLIEQRFNYTQSSLPNKKQLFIFSIPMGIIATCFGVGIGPTCVPLLKRCGLSISKAITVATFVGGVIVFFATTGFIIMGHNQTNLPTYSVGYIYLPMLVSIGFPSIVFARLGSRLTYLVPPKVLKSFFAVFLIIISIIILI